MAKAFDPRSILRKLSPPLLRSLLTEAGANDTIEWDNVTRRHVEPIFEWLQCLPSEQHRLISTVLQDVHELANDRGMALLAEDMRTWPADMVTEFDAIDGQPDRALWCWLHAKPVFQTAALFARADALASGRSWHLRNSLPPCELVVRKEQIEALRTALRTFYLKRDGRGQGCQVEHYPRTDGTQWFFAYPEDFPDAAPVLDERDQLTRTRERRVFDNFFVFHPQRGTLEIYAVGGRELIDALQVLACKAVLNLDVEPTPDVRPAYRLQHLLAPDRALPTDPADGIESVEIARVRLGVLGRPGVTIELGLNPPLFGIDEAISTCLNTKHLTPDVLLVKQMQFRVRFMDGGSLRKLTINVSLPNTCDLKSKPEAARLIGERCLRRWGVIHD
jgi:hypothetical protein